MMPYCVHCGVKLNQAEKRCPLCGTPVFDPNSIDQAASDNEPIHIDMYPRRDINWRFLSKVTVAILATISCMTILCDLLTAGMISWSCFSLAGCVLLAGIAAIPDFKNVVLKILIPFMGAAFALFLAAIATQGLKWFLYLALPGISIAAIYTIVSVWLASKKKLRLLYRVVICLILLIVFLIVIEIITDLYAENEIHIFWSLYAVIPLSFIAVVFTITAHNNRMIDYIRKNMFLSPQ